MRGPSPLYIEERHRALGRDATFLWSRALTRPPRCNRTRHRGRHLVFDFVGPPSWISLWGAAILDRTSWGPPSWTGSDVKSAIVGPILLRYLIMRQFIWVFIARQSCQFITRHFIRVCAAYHTHLGDFSMQTCYPSIVALNFQQQLSNISSEPLCVPVRAVKLQTRLWQWPGSSETSLVAQLLVPNYPGPTPDYFCILV